MLDIDFERDTNLERSSQPDEPVDDFDIKAFRGHFRIAASHFESGVAAFETLQKKSRRQAARIKELETELRQQRIAHAGDGVPGGFRG